MGGTSGTSGGNTICQIHPSYGNDLIVIYDLVNKSSFIQFVSGRHVRLLRLTFSSLARKLVLMTVLHPVTSLSVSVSPSPCRLPVAKKLTGLTKQRSGIDLVH